MTVQELKELLSSMPNEAKVYRDGGEYIGDSRSVHEVTYYPEFNRKWEIKNAVLIK